jgi:hypothetical protein
MGKGLCIFFSVALNAAAAETDESKSERDETSLCHQMKIS